MTANLHAESDLNRELQPGTEVSEGMKIQNAKDVEAKFDNSTKQLRVNFNTQINDLKRPSDGRSRSERVTEHKYGMIFSLTLMVTGKVHLVKVILVSLFRFSLLKTSSLVTVRHRVPTVMESQGKISGHGKSKNIRSRGKVKIQP